MLATKGRINPRSIEDVIAKFVTKTDKCWYWHGTNNAGGYGVLYDSDKTYLAHRWIYEKLKGPISNCKCEKHEPLSLHHKCENTLCVNPEHLEPISETTHPKRHIPYSRFYASKLSRSR